MCMGDPLVVLQCVGDRAVQGMPLPALERAEKLLGLAQQFLERAASPALPDLAEAHLAKPLSQLSAMLAGMGPFSDWHAAAKGVLNAQLQLSALMLERCKVEIPSVPAPLLCDVPGHPLTSRSPFGSTHWVQFVDVHGPLHSLTHPCLIPPGCWQF